MYKKVINSIRSGFAWLGGYEMIIYILLISIAGGIWVFMELADEVLEGETHVLDERILLLFRTNEDLSDPLGPHWVEELLRDFTALGGTGILTVVTISVAGYLLLHRKYRISAFVVISVMGGLIFSLFLKNTFDRPRPDLVPHGTYVYTTSFPSGHSMLSAVTYLTLGALVARFQKNLSVKAYIIVLSILLTFVVGVSRVYLGVHYPTDVLAGWTAGAVWALLCWLVARQLQRQGRVEQNLEENQNSEGG